MVALLTGLLASLLLAGALPLAAEEQADVIEVTGTQPVEVTETIIVRADRAWEEEDSDEVLHFAGNFELISPDWELTADEADLFGPIDDPQRIVARGVPAVVTILNQDETVVGEGGTVEYVRATEILTLTDNAQIISDKVSMKSAEIVYDLGARRLKSSGDTGVEMILQREKAGSD